MLSIIVAVHNQIGHNELFMEGIRQYTTDPYEVIVIDNHSTDGSAEFFEANGCRVIRNAENLCYPESMNLGIGASHGKYLCLINNDVYVGPNWNEILIAEMERLGLCAASPLGLETMPTPELSVWVQDRWASIGRGRLSSGKAFSRLRTMIREMYGDWEGFCVETHRFFSGKVYEGIIGSCVMLRRDLFEKIGMLDEHIQSADWDLYYILRKRENEVGDVRRCMIVGGSYVHHFMRATATAKPEPYACRHERLSIDEKWTREEQARLWFKPEELLASRSATSKWISYRGRLGKLIKKLVREINRALSWRWLLVKPDQIVEIYKRKFMTAGSCS